MGTEAAACRGDWCGDGDRASGAAEAATGDAALTEVITGMMEEEGEGTLFVVPPGGERVAEFSDWHCEPTGLVELPFVDCP